MADADASVSKWRAAAEEPGFLGANRDESELIEQQDQAEVLAIGTYHQLYTESTTVTPIKRSQLWRATASTQPRDAAK